MDTKTGYVYEKSLIEKYLIEKARCPMTGNEMSKDDLLPLKMGKPIKPRHSPQMSIPGILGMLHNVIFPNSAAHVTLISLPSRRMLFPALYSSLAYSCIKRVHAS